MIIGTAAGVCPGPMNLEHSVELWIANNKHHVEDVRYVEDID